MTAPLAHLGAAEVAASIRAGITTAEAVMQACLSRISEREEAVGAFISIDPERVIAAAKAADQSPPVGPLHGVPFAIKDIIETADHPTGWGSRVYAGRRTGRNASCVELMLRAGAVPVGKTVSTEFAYFSPGKTANPVNLGHTPGGSSSGSAAAVADRMVPLAFGSQTAASLIRPAAYCGVPGYKPTHGDFDLDGVMGLAPSLDTLGVYARDVTDFILVRAALCHSDPAASAGFEDRAPRIALMRGPHWWEGSLEMRDTCTTALAKLAAAGAETGELAHPDIFGDLTEAQKTVMAYETARTRIYEYSRHRSQVSDHFISLVETGLAIPRAAYEAAVRTRATAQRILEQMFMEVDAILAPAAPGEAPAGLGATGDPLYSRAWTLLQVPCIALPSGTGPNGLPLAVQLVGRHGGDDRLLAVAAWAAGVLAPKS
ncbi:MAG: amidase [Rhizobiales bacterium]|nr:amidase [Hyphomicrobiales bacterium]